MAENTRKEPSNSYSPWRRHFRNTVRIFLLCVIALIGYRLLKLPPQLRVAPDRQQGVGQPLARLSLQSLVGGSSHLTLAELKGRVTLLNFWGTWCGPCRREIPHLAAIHERFAGQPAFQLLAVSYPAGGQLNDVISLRDETTSLLRQLKIKMPIYYDPSGETWDAAGQLADSDGFPTTLLLDRRGIVRAVWLGYRPGAENEMEHWISLLLDEKTPPKPVK